MTLISGYHAHVYFDASTVKKARALCEAARDALPVKMGRVHEKMVGPHPMWSCQLSFDAADFAEVIPWLILNRDGLIIFSHPETGDALIDHRDRALWMGAYLALNLSIFE